MATEVDICNLALSHLGDAATITSISPPEGSPLAEHCARFYPLARDLLLEGHPWNFASRRADLALMATNWDQWLYTYALPADCITVTSVIPADSSNDYMYGYSAVEDPYMTATASVAAPVEYSVESLDDGTKIIFTNQENARIRYQARIEDTSKFPPLFTMSLSWQLASMIAGPVLKADFASKEEERCMKMMLVYLTQARQADSQQRNIKLNHVASWMNVR